MRIAHVQATFSPEHGGPVHTLSNYCRGQMAGGHAVSVWALEGFPHTSPAVRLEAPCEMHVFPVEFPAKLGSSPALRRALADVPPSDVYHLHGGWLRAPFYGACEALRRRRPYVLELMGIYEPYGLRTKSLQKWLARKWFQDRVLQQAGCLHVNSEREARHLRLLGFQAPIAVIPCGVDLDAIRKHDTQSASEKFPALRDNPFVLFLARIDAKKGIEILLRAWKQISGAHPEWRLAIAGSGEPEYVARCRQLAGELGLDGQCVWTGPVNEAEKSWLYANAACFVLPSFSENFGNTVAEALAHGTPAITTTETPWAHLPAEKCGWVAEATPESLAEGLRAAVELDAATRATMSQNAAKLAHKRYGLSGVLQSLDDVYSWLVNGARQPDCVQMK